MLLIKLCLSLWCSIVKLKFIVMDITSIYEKHYSDVFRYVLARTGNVETAEEIASDTFVKANENLSSYDSEKSAVKTWLFNIAKNLVIDNWRTTHYEKKRVLVSSYTDESGNESFQYIDDVSADDGIKAEEYQNKIRKAFDKLKPEYRKVIEQYFIQKMKYREIAEMFGLSMSNVKVIINRSRKILQAELTKQGVFSA